MVCMTGDSSPLSGRVRVRGAIATRIGLAAVLISAVAMTGDAQSGGDDANRPDALHPLVTGAQYERWQTELSNWGRPHLFGPGSIHTAHREDEHVKIAELRDAVFAYETLAIAGLRGVGFAGSALGGVRRGRR